MSAAPCVDLLKDSALPYRDLLLDIPQAARRLSARIGVDGPIEIQRCERARVKYLPGTSLRVLYRVQVSGRLYTIATRTFTAGLSRSVFERAVSRAVPSGVLLPVGHDAELDMVYWTFPNDRKINSLAALTSPPERLATIGRLRWATSRAVAYAPEKCVTAECLSDAGVLLAYAKVYAADESPTYPLYEALWRSLGDRGSRLRVPRALAYCEQDHLLLLEPMAGRRLSDLRRRNRAEGFHRLGVGLAALHQVPAPAALRPFTRLRPDRLQEAARIIAVARPDVYGLGVELAEQLSERRPGLKDSDVCLHGDVHPKNGVLQNDRIALIDLDQAGTGPAAADIGSLLAALRYSCLVKAMSRADERELAGAFLRGYREGGQLPEADSLRWHVAAALLAERALRAVNRVRAEGLKHLNDLLHDSRSVLMGRDYE